LARLSARSLCGSAVLGAVSVIGALLSLDFMGPRMRTSTFHRLVAATVVGQL
jgi:hypothetical protein